MSHIYHVTILILKMICPVLPGQIIIG